MSILRAVLSIGAGLLAMTACYVGMSKTEERVNESMNSSNKCGSPDASSDAKRMEMDPMMNQMGQSGNQVKSNNILEKLDRLQVALLNLARFISEVVRAVSLFIRATNYYEYNRAPIG